MREHAVPLTDIDVPCTIVWGTQDFSHRDTTPDALRQYLPHVEIIRFEDCGHFPDLEQPERYASIVTERIV